MLLVLLGLALGFFAYQEALPYTARGLIFVAPIRGEGHVHFEFLPDLPDLPEESISIESRARLLVSRGDRQLFSQIIYTDAEHFRLLNMNFIEGAPWLGETEDRSIVINEALAWYLFGGNNVLGLSVGIGEEFYRISAVVRQAGDEYMAWLPIGDRALPVSAFYFEIYPRTPLDARHEVYQLLGEHRLSDYAIVDLRSYVENIGIGHRILLYALWLLILIAFIRRIWAYGICLKALPLLLLAGLALRVLFGINDIILWLPNPSDPNSSVLASISNAQALPPEVYLSYGMRQLSRLNRLSNVALLLGFLGLINLLFTGVFSFGSEEVQSEEVHSEEVQSEDLQEDF